jgi:hypothetical protein
VLLSGKNWDLLRDKIPTRTDKQINSHMQKVLGKLTKRSVPGPYQKKHGVLNDKEKIVLSNINFNLRDMTQPEKQEY